MEFDWDTANVAHIARHGITPGGVRGSLLERADGDRSPGTEARTPEPVPGGRSTRCTRNSGRSFEERNDANQHQGSKFQIGKGRSRMVGRAPGGRYGAVPEGEEGREDQAAARGPRGYQIHDDPAADRRY